MLKNMKVKVSLIMGWAVTLLVSLVIIIATLVIMNKQTSTYQKIIDKDILLLSNKMRSLTPSQLRIVENIIDECIRLFQTD